MITNEIASLQQLNAEEIEMVAGATCTGCGGCSPTATCARTTCQGETVVDEEGPQG